MFKIIRKKTVAKFTLWFLIATFVIWGGGTAVTRRKTGGDSAGSIFGKKVSWELYSKNLFAVRTQGMMRYGDRFKEVESLLGLEDQAWDRLILLFEAKRKRISTSDKEIIETMQKMPIFQKTGVFDNRTYQTLLQYALGIEARQFEEQMRDTITITKLIQKITDEVALSDEQIRQFYLKTNQKVSISYILVEPKEFISQINPAQDELKGFYEKNKETFQKPQQANVQYIGINFSDIEANIAEEIADKISKALKETPDFEKISKDYPVIIKETGFFTSQDMIPEIGFSYPFINAAFSLKENEISEAVKTQKGIYFLKLKETKQSYIMSFDEAKDSVKDIFVQNEAEALAKKTAEDLNNKIKEMALSNPKIILKEIAASLNKQLKTAEEITASSYIEGLGQTEEFIDVISNLKVGQISDVVKTQKGFCVLTVDKFEPIDEEKFNKEKETFKTQMVSQKKIEHFNNWFENLKNTAKTQKFR